VAASIYLRSAVTCYYVLKIHFGRCLIIMILNLSIQVSMHAYNIYSVLLEQTSFQVEKSVSFLNSIRNVRRLLVAISLGGCAHVMSLFLL